MLKRNTCNRCLLDKYSGSADVFLSRFIWLYLLILIISLVYLTEIKNKKRMSNTGEDNIDNEKILTQHNEEETTTIEIDEISHLSVNISNTQLNESGNNECRNDELNKKNVIQTIVIDIEKGINKTNELEQKCAVLQSVKKDRKLPSLWVQYNQIYSKATRHQQYGGGGMSYDPGSRNYFIKFVFLVLFVMLALTAAYGVAVLTVEPIKEFYQDFHFILMILSMVVLLGMNYAVACTTCARVPPCNFICLIVVVIAMSNLVGAVTVRYRTNIVVLALIATIITVFLCCLLACSSFDFTAWYIYVIVIAMVFMAISMVASITMLAMGMRFKPLQLVLLFIGTLIQVVILIMELQMVLGGKTIEIGEDDYALAAYLLYTSIVDIFLQIVQGMALMDD